PGPPVHLRGLELHLVLLMEQLAQRAVVERRERPGQGVPRGPERRVDHELRERLADRVDEPERLEPFGRGRAGRRLALADLVPVDHQDARTRARELPCDREPRERRPADEHVEITLQRGPLYTALRAPHRHERSAYRSRREPLTLRSVPDTDTLT